MEVAQVESEGKGGIRRLFRHWRDPEPESLGDSALEFLQRLRGPTCIELTGRDPSRCRALATLLHGNEPSGLLALYDVLRGGLRPAVNIICFIPSVGAATRPPTFSFRMLPERKDLNRCFTPPYGNTEVDRLALEMLDLLEAARPECVIDVHNTSGSSPSFGISTVMEARHGALISLFTQRMIVTDLRLGALMERTRDDMPIVTIECGGAEDHESTLLAGEGLSRYFTMNEVLDSDPEAESLEFFHHPMRLELASSSGIAFGESPAPVKGVTLLPSVENYNFGHVGPDTLLGFVDGELADHLRVRDAEGSNPVAKYFRQEQGRLYPSRKLKLFMVTTKAEIARKDCLFYLTEL